MARKLRDKRCRLRLCEPLPALGAGQQLHPPLDDAGHSTGVEPTTRDLLTPGLAFDATE